MALLTTYSLLRATLVLNTQRAGMKQQTHKTIAALYKRRQKLGPEPLHHRSEQSDWNYTAELSAFGKRLNEDFQLDTLRTAFTHKSYLFVEEKKRSELNLPLTDIPLELKDNASLVEEGEQLIGSYIRDFLSFVLPAFPQEGVDAVCKFLMSEDVLSQIASSIGVGDLVLCEEFPPTKLTLAQSLKAVVAGLSHDQSVNRADVFVQDFILTHLIGKDINDIWEITNPMGLLAEVLQKQGRGLPEPRLLREAGRETILAIYVVGVYSDKTFIGSGPGETLAIAEEMAARDALRRIFQTTDDKIVMPFGAAGRNLSVRKV